MTDVMRILKSWLSLLPGFHLANMFEVLIIAAIVYVLLNWIMSTRAFTLLKGIFVILLFTFVAFVFRLTTIQWIIEKFSTVAVIALVIIFQPELRKALEQLGSRWMIGSLVSAADTHNMLSKESASMISKAVFQMAAVRTGALIVIEQNEKLGDFISTGIPINGDISTGLIINIFEKNTPLHDGAVIVRGNSIAAATCYLPLSESMSISKDLGTRHRAALGISEITDSITIVVSEETGHVSCAYRGKLIDIREEKDLDSLLFGRINKAEVKLFRRLRVSSGDRSNG